MEMTLKLQILKSIGKIYESANNCELTKAYFRKNSKDIKVVADYLKLPDKQAFFAAMIFALNYKGNTVDISDLIRYFDCNPMAILEYSDDLETLYQKGIIWKSKSHHKINVEVANDQFTINKKITEAILRNQPMTILEKSDYKDIIELLEEMALMLKRRSTEELATFALFDKTEDIIAGNLHFPLINKISELIPEASNAFIYLFLIWRTLSGCESIDLANIMEELFDNASERVASMQGIMIGENQLVKLDLVETAEAMFFNQTELKLTEKSLKILRKCDIKVNMKKKNNANIIKPSKITERKLVFHDEEMKQLTLVKNLLNDTKLTETQNRLLARNLPKGITILLHGFPGTGKTETVMQLARETNREIMKVEISQSKSVWFGESEKIIKGIFTDYQTFTRECDRLPILLFNEADAIFSKRQEISSSNLAQTENAIQNIILEELETFEGLLFATTNLTMNFDSAFERRFLFKIEFRKPDAMIKAKIWQLKLAKLSASECETLASRFDFTGGQIDNIVRKCEIQETIHGEAISFEGIVEFCEEEGLVVERNRIGFR